MFYVHLRAVSPLDLALRLLPHVNARLLETPNCLGGFVLFVNVVPGSKLRMSARPDRVDQTCVELGVCVMLDA